MGQKGPKGEPQKLSTFRFTSADRGLLEEVAERYGGEVTEWTGAPDEGYFQVTTNAKQLDVILLPRYSEIDGSPSTTYSQWYELWSASGCQRRCDGRTEQLSQEPCLCAAESESSAGRACQIVTRVSFMLPGQRVGLWRLDTRGYYAAVEAPAMLDFLANAAEGELLPAVLRIENRTLKRNGQSLKFIVPVFDFPGANVPELPQGSVPLSLNPPQRVTDRPALPAGTPEPSGNSFENDKPPVMADRPALSEREHEMASPTPSPLPRSESVADEPADSLTPAEFKQLRADERIEDDEVREVGRILFAGRTLAQLTNEERGVLAHALLKRKAGATA